MFGTVKSHTYFSSLIINGEALPEFDGLRPYPTSDKEYPLADMSMRPNGIHSNDMTCGFLPEAARPANRKITIAAGSSIGLQWWHVSPGDDVLSPSHKGPCMVYMAKSDTGAGNVWFKIWEKGYDASRGKWCTDDMIAARGVLRGITIPADISPGNYLLRAEIIALHDANKPHGPQPYVHCAELSVTGSGNANPPGVAIPGVYNDDNLYFDLYSSYNSYTIPGPAVYVAGSPSTHRPPSPPQPPSPPETPSTTTTGTTTGSSSGTPSRPSSNSRCTVSISQSSTSSWTDHGAPVTLYTVVMTNTGSSTLDLKFRISAPPVDLWSVVRNSDGTFGLPAWPWLLDGLKAGQSFQWGYIVLGITPLSIDLVVPSC